MRYEADSDAAMAYDRHRRQEERRRRNREAVRKKARYDKYIEITAEAQILGYTLVKHCPYCKSIKACMCSR